MNIVVDASVAVRWYVQMPGTEEAHALFEGNESFIAPDLVVAEIANTAWKLARAGQLTEDAASIMVYRAESAFAGLIPLAELVDRAFEISRKLDHPIYDCLYLAVTELEEARMVTADKRLVRKVRGTQWEEQVELLRTA
jgi:predicted nucleic acid-binding protein